VPNNGRLTQSIDGASGETVNYTYDVLNRLIAAQATNNSWGNAYSYDGFGNLTGKTVTAGSAPSFSVSYDPAAKRQIGQSYEANGNRVAPNGNG
jgi:YD repeat-containing protein